jgi:flavin reductase (DIM6/NTAB) family NADH-FMN oxidoreductase RutF
MTCLNTRSNEALSRTTRLDFLDAMSRTATGVNIVTTDGPAGKAGLTVSAMSSVSADGLAPQLLVCTNRNGSAANAILENGVFVLNVLRDDQTSISDVFAGRHASNGTDRFSYARWVPMATGAPRLVDPVAAFDCRIAHVHLVGTHYVIFGAVVDIFSAESGKPLVYTRRAYTSLLSPDSSPAPEIRSVCQESRNATGPSARIARRRQEPRLIRRSRPATTASARFRTEPHGAG